MGLAMVDLLPYSYVNDATFATDPTEIKYQENHHIPFPEFPVSPLYSYLLFFFPGMDGVYAVLGYSLPWRSLKATTPKIKEVEKINLL